jgi:N-acetylglucosamine malate deacetylase 2
MNSGQFFLGKRLVFIIAHPDDESYLAAGTIYKNRGMGGESFVICATAGEQGSGHLPHAVSKAKLKQIRKKELTKVCRILGVKQLLTLNFPDCKVEQNSLSLKNLLIKNLRRLQPDLVISFGSDGFTGHKDHIAVGKIARDAAQTMKLPFLALSGPPSFTQAILKKRRKQGIYNDKVKRIKPNLVIKVDPNIKFKCLCQHTSQSSNKNPLQGLPPKVVQDILTKEYFIIEKRGP